MALNHPGPLDHLIKGKLTEIKSVNDTVAGLVTTRREILATFAGSHVQIIMAGRESDDCMTVDVDGVRLIQNGQSTGNMRFDGFAKGVQLQGFMSPSVFCRVLGMVAAARQGSFVGEHIVKEQVQ